MELEVLLMLNNYLTNRNQYVIADDHSSGMRLITCGVPQGSVLGPVLFLLYINDICNVSNLLKFVLFADDTNIFCSSTSLHDLQDTINRELDKLFVWFSVNLFPLIPACTGRPGLPLSAPDIAFLASPSRRL